MTPAPVTDPLAVTETPPARARRVPHRLTARRTLVTLGLLAIVVLPLQVADASLGTLSYAAVYTVAALGMTVVVGQTGQVSLAQPFFMGLGAYVAAYGAAELGLSLLATVAVAMIGGALVGLLVGWVAIRIGGVELAIVTLGLVFVGDYLFHEVRSVTGGENGTGVGDLSLSFFGVDLEGGDTFTRPQIMFWTMWAVVALVALVLHQVLKQTTGRAMVAARENPRAAEAIGVDVRRYKTMAFTIASALGALAGVLFALLQSYVTPADFDLELALLLMAMIVLGGQAAISGAIVGAVVVYGFFQWLSEQADSPVLSGLLKSSENDPGLLSPGDFNHLVLGVLIVLVLVLRPGGVVDAVGSAYHRIVGSRTPRARNAWSSSDVSSASDEG